MAYVDLVYRIIYSTILTILLVRENASVIIIDVGNDHGTYFVLVFYQKVLGG